MPHLDHELLELSRQLEAAWAIENEAWKAVMNLPDGTCDGSVEYKAAVSANDVSSALVVRIRNLPAASIEGLKVKARAILWCHSDDLGFEADVEDMRLVKSIVEDLLAA